MSEWSKYTQVLPDFRARFRGSVMKGISYDGKEGILLQSEGDKHVHVRVKMASACTTFRGRNIHKSSIRVNYNISLTWILRPFGDDFPYTNHDSRLRENSEVVMKFNQIYYTYIINKSFRIITTPPSLWLFYHCTMVYDHYFIRTIITITVSFISYITIPYHHDYPLVN